jgi:hypothetical protein
VISPFHCAYCCQMFPSCQNTPTCQYTTFSFLAVSQWSRFLTYIKRSCPVSTTSHLQFIKPALQNCIASRIIFFLARHWLISWWIVLHFHVCGYHVGAALSSPLTTTIIVQAVRIKTLYCPCLSSLVIMIRVAGVLSRCPHFLW